MQIKNIFHCFWVLLMVGSLSISVSAQEGEADLDAGKALFKTNCASCHNRNMKDDLTGPALSGTEERWSEYPQEDLYSWIRNSQAMIQEGHPRAVELWDDWKPTVMTNFQNLSDQDIANILGYIKGVSEGTYGASESAGQATAVTEEVDTSYTLLYVTLALILGILGLILARIASVLNSLAIARETGEKTEAKTFKELLTSRTVIFFVIFAIVVLGGYTTVNNAVDLGRQQGYQPEQPIKFSHVQHAGMNQIDCQFCHDGARRSKHSVIPAGNTCMNCHSAIKNGTRYGTAELTKIYVSLGYDPSTDTYLENYMEMEQDSIAEVYKKWISDEWKKDNGVEEMTNAGSKVVEDQWNHIVESLTNEQKDKVQGPIEWVRVHNLPDHVYFNHAQHVAVGEVECQQCHGTVEEMEVLSQHAPLSMGWCINCHRESEVSGISGENGYYMKAYEDYVKALDIGEMEEVTVEDIGGLECQKCHY